MENGGTGMAHLKKSTKTQIFKENADDSVRGGL
jgi:hypothetical protein